MVVVSEPEDLAVAAAQLWERQPWLKRMVVKPREFLRGQCAAGSQTDSEWHPKALIQNGGSD